MASIMYDLKNKLLIKDYQFITSVFSQCIFFPEFNKVTKRNNQIDINFSEKDKPSTCLIDLFSLVTRLRVENTEKYIPQVLNSDKLNTVNYKKGCYTGQEVIARTHYLGNVKKHVYLVNINNSEICETNIINKDGESVGELIGERFIYKDVNMSHSILRDSCDFNELFLGKDVVKVIPMEDIV